MSYLEKYFASRTTKSLFVPYFSLGDPSYKSCIEWGKSILDGGADILELGIPFTDPVADGPVIQKSYKRALDNQPFEMDTIFDTTASIHSFNREIPIVFLGYLNPIIHYGISKFFKQAYLSGVKGMVIPDIPFDTKDFREIHSKAKENGVDIINLITPATDEKRMDQMKEYASGFIYYVTSFGVTGERKNLDVQLQKRIEKVKRKMKIPVCAGFGISTPDQAGEVSEFADGVIIGSAIQKIIEEKSSNIQECKDSLNHFIKSVRSKMK